MKTLLSLTRFAIMLALLAFWQHSLAEAPPGAPTVEVIKAKIKQTEATTELDDASKARLIELYSTALSNLELMQSSQAATENYRRARETASAEAKSIVDSLEARKKAKAADSLTVSDSTPLPEIEQALLKEKADRTAVQAKLDELEQRLAAEAERPKAIRDELNRATQRKGAIAAELKAPVVGENQLITEARVWVSQSEEMELNARIVKLDQELLSQPARIELMKAERDKLALSLTRIGERVQLMESMLGGKRVAVAQQAQAKAEEEKREAMGKHPLVQELAARNAALSQEMATMAADLDKVMAEETTASKQAKRFGDEFRSTQQKLEVAGLSQAFGRVLLEQRRALPNPRLFRKKIANREDAVADAGLRQIQHEEEKRQLADPAAYVDELVAGLPPEEAGAIRDELLALAESRLALLDTAIATDQARVRALGELEFAQRQLLDTVEAYDDFLNERLLWVRSSPTPSLATLMEIPEQAIHLLSPVHWLQVLQILAGELLGSLTLAPGLALFGILVWKAKKLRQLLRDTGTPVGRIRTDSFVFTFQALGLTLLLAAPWPLLLALTGWHIALSAEATDFAKAVARGLIWVSNALFYLESFRLLCLRGGLAAAHFHWPQESLKLLHRDLVRLMVSFLPAAFVALVIITYDSPTMGGGLGRLAFVMVLVSLGVFFYHLFQPEHGPLSAYLDSHPKSALTRLRPLWLTLGVAVPAGLAGLAVMGYLYTAGTLTGSLIDTLWFILTLVVVQQMVLRWLLLTSRRLSFRAAVERREAARAAALAQQTTTQPAGDEMPEVEEPVVDLDALSDDSRKLLNMTLDIVGLIGIWVIWSKVLPAFGIMDTIALWQYSGTIDGQEASVSVTVADAILALLILAITIVATKRFPALLEIALLQRLKVTAGGRYAAKTLSSYTIAAIGTVVAFSTLGAQWSQIQWLVAALGVGIGFGLQEIVANFISGLIILFERPIRVGDTVTVADTSGVVTRIRIRATTIKNWEGQELLVPNKEFITARLLNWTLSDPITRIVIPVGLVYGGDVEKAMTLLLQAAEEHPEVLKDPRPSVVFDEFGDNALSLKLRCYVGSMDNRIFIFSDLHRAINRKFNDAGLVIAFPQRDVHLDTSKPLDIRIHHEGPPSPAAG